MMKGGTNGVMVKRLGRSNDSRLKQLIKICNTNHKLNYQNYDKEDFLFP